MNNDVMAAIIRMQNNETGPWLIELRDGDWFIGILTRGSGNPFSPDLVFIVDKSGTTRTVASTDIMKVDLYTPPPPIVEKMEKPRRIGIHVEYRPESQPKRKRKKN